MRVVSKNKSSRRVFLGNILAAGGALYINTASSEERWQAYTYWASSVVPAAKAFESLVTDINNSIDGLQIQNNWGGTLSIAGSNITNAVGQNIIQFADDAFYHGSVPIANLVGLPFIASDLEMADKLVKLSWPLAEKEFERVGVKLLSYYLYPPQIVWSRKIIKSVDDLRGKKTRVSSPEQTAWLQKVGGSSINMSSAEVAAGLERGVIDAILTASAGGVAAWEDLLKSCYNIPVNFTVSYILANKRRFDGLSDEEKDALRDLVRVRTKGTTIQLQKDNIELLEKFREDGMIINNAGAEELSEMRKLSVPIWDEWAKSLGEDAEKLLINAKELTGD